MIMVSVICPTYNQGRFLRQGLDSILAQQTDFEYEILIGEDCSPDDTCEILKPYEERYADRIKVFHREKNLRQSKNVYDLFMRSKGRYIIILDLDDYWTDPCKLQKQVDFMEAHPEYIGIAHDFTVVDTEGKLIEGARQPIKKHLNKSFSLQDFLEEGFVFQTGTFCYRNIWKEDTDWSILYRADHTIVDLTINSILMQRQDIFILPDSMSAYREVINTDALNCRSLFERDLAKHWREMTGQIEKLYTHFDKKIDYSRMWSNMTMDYLKALLKHREGNFTFKEWLGIFMRSSAKTKNRVLKSLLGSIGRKFKKSKACT